MLYAGAKCPLQLSSVLGPGWSSRCPFIARLAGRHHQMHASDGGKPHYRQAATSRQRRRTLHSPEHSPGALDTVQEQLEAAPGCRVLDPGSWNLSPEWWGTQDSGWGRDAGQVIFRQQSACGNGEVTVTSHVASDGNSGAEKLGEEWRVLRFNEVTRQSVSRVGHLAAGGHRPVEAIYSCLAFPYLRTMATAGAAIIALAGLWPAMVRLEEPNPRQPRALCIGMGGGSLPMFLAHHFPGMQVDVVELDPVVIAAAYSAMGFPQHWHNLTVHQAEATQFLSAWVQKGGEKTFDLVFLDAFDGEDDVPQQLSTPGSPFTRDLAAALNPEHGTLIMNLHGGGRPALSPGRLLGMLLGRRDPNPGYDPTSAAGAAVQQAATCFRDALLRNEGEGAASHGSVFTLSVPKQQNMILTVTRMPRPESAAQEPDWLQAPALTGALAAGYCFASEEHIISRDYHPLN